MRSQTLMVSYLRDPANAITAVGLCFALLALYYVHIGQLEVALAAALWALIADHVDGIVAARTRNRRQNAGAIGKQLDSFTDLISDSVFPAMLVLQLNGASLLSLGLAGLLLLAGALRLSYFNTFGLSGGQHFTGVPLSYDLPALALLFLFRPWLEAQLFQALVNSSLLLLAVLHVSSLLVPKARGVYLGGIIAFTVASSVALFIRGMQ
ncbi:CDP-alcohol phosphatidyltransferase family protein [Steroidobacter sp. S1-65]|uniref:CDP-alcohol phosphatidyltransferase family protein n=1 Tax=Steroidobacter gossypii TaxID=2805490 RepID=A0ABS1WYE4_9GAMM|nr:CDP-alcohol phosphatidyltransferase family protein [Steroidobacter gossypii]MBM0105962.1 CDP-alcohol phosphatidyltransferase family protein [Steroidobacter gossypii]